MHPPPKAWPAAGANQPAPTLVLPRHVLDAQVALALRHAAVDPTPGWLALGPLVLQPAWPVPLLLVGSLLPGPPQRLPADAHRRSGSPHGPLARPMSIGLFLLYLAAPHETPPAGTGAGANHPAHEASVWNHWLARHAPDHRLATLVLQPDMALLWLRADGLVRAVFRPGQAWAAWQQAGQGAAVSAAGPAPWWPLTHLQLPGSDMLELALGITTNPHDEDAGPDPAGRYSRQAAALGPAVLRRWQRCCFGVVGAGRAGSVLAHSLLRSGASVRVIDSDTLSPHSLDGDLPPCMEGQPKVLALQRQLQGLARPGATLTPRTLAVSSPAAGQLLAGVDIVVCAADNDAAALWANAWALATLKPLLVVASGLHPHGAEVDLRLLPPGAGCLACTGGFSQLAQLPAQLALPGPVPTPAELGQQRAGSLRSWGQLASHSGLRLLEHLVAGRIRQPLFRRLLETADGGLQVHDWQPPANRHLTCPLCQRLQGAGLAAVQPAVLLAVVAQLATRGGAG